MFESFLYFSNAEVCTIGLMHLDVADSLIWLFIFGAIVVLDLYEHELCPDKREVLRRF